jgi:tRNA threonylcarbamoyladenosine biosynthesis protein TsaB
LLLAFDTASRFISLALHDGHRLHFESTWPTSNNHTIELAPAIRHALAQTRIGVADLTAVAVAQGPGSFTGLRIGLGVAKGLAMARQMDLVAIPTLNIIAAGAPAFDGDLMAVLQAGRGRICAQRFHRTGDRWTPADQAVITTWEQQIDAMKQTTLYAGEIDDTGRALLDAAQHPASIAPGAFSLRRAGFLAELAWARIKMNDTDDPAATTPIYLHQPGAPTP